MYKCQHCNIYVYDDAEACPLCHRVLDEIEEKERQSVEACFGEGAPYPDVRKRNKTLHFVMRLILFIFIVAQISLFVVNRYVMPSFLWSGISGVALVFIYVSMVYWINHDSGFAAKIGFQLIFTMALLYGIDYFSGMHGWALQWAIPGIILAGDGLVFFLMMLNRQHWYSYTLLLLLIALCSCGIISLYFAGRISNIVLPVLCVTVTGFYLLATIIFGDRELKRELKRRFRV